MTKIHDKFVIELAEVIKGYGNDPDVDDPFRLSEFYRFYELPEIAVSANHFKTMIPLEVVEKNAQPGWIPVTERFLKDEEEVIVSIHDDSGDYAHDYTSFGWHIAACEYWIVDNALNWQVTAWMPLPKPWEGDTNAR